MHSRILFFLVGEKLARLTKSKGAAVAFSRKDKLMRKSVLAF
jgi:hypothetical protein